MSNLPVYVETKKAEELQAGVMLSQTYTQGFTFTLTHFASKYVQV